MFLPTYFLAIACDGLVVYLHQSDPTSFPPTALDASYFRSTTFGLTVLAGTRLAFLLPLLRNYAVSSRLRLPPLYNLECALSLLLLFGKALLLTVLADSLPSSLFLSRQFVILYLSLAATLLQLLCLDHLRSSAPRPAPNARLMYAPSREQAPRAGPKTRAVPASSPRDASSPRSARSPRSLPPPN
jgi:hypothetical protein